MAYSFAPPGHYHLVHSRRLARPRFYWGYAILNSERLVGDFVHDLLNDSWAAPLPVANVALGFGSFAPEFYRQIGIIEQGAHPVLCCLDGALSRAVLVGAVCFSRKHGDSFAIRPLGDNLDDLPCVV